MTATTFENVTVTAEQLAELFERAADRLDRTGWQQESDGPVEGPNCVNGALKWTMTATGLIWHEGKHGWLAHDGWPRHKHSLDGRTVTPEHGPALHAPGVGEPLSAFSPEDEPAGVLRDPVGDELLTSGYRVLTDALNQAVIDWNDYECGSESEAASMLRVTALRVRRGELLP
jgi:hypothetical protein